MRIDEVAYGNRTAIHGFAKPCAPNKVSIIVMSIPIINIIFVRNDVNVIFLRTGTASK